MVEKSHSELTRKLGLASDLGSETLEVCAGGSMGVYLVTLLVQVAAANGRAAAVMANMEIYVDGGNGGDQAEEDIISRIDPTAPLPM